MTSLHELPKCDDCDAAYPYLCEPHFRETREPKPEEARELIARRQAEADADDERATRGKFLTPIALFFAGLIIGAGALSLPYAMSVEQVETLEGKVAACANAAGKWQGSAGLLRESNVIMGSVAEDLIAASWWQYDLISQNIDDATELVDSANTLEDSAPDCRK